MFRRFWGRKRRLAQEPLDRFLPGPPQGAAMRSTVRPVDTSQLQVMLDAARRRDEELLRGQQWTREELGRMTPVSPDELVPAPQPTLRERLQVAKPGEQVPCTLEEVRAMALQDAESLQAAMLTGAVKVEEGEKILRRMADPNRPDPEPAMQRSAKLDELAEVVPMPRALDRPIDPTPPDPRLRHGAEHRARHGWAMLSEAMTLLREASSELDLRHRVTVSVSDHDAMKLRRRMPPEILEQQPHSIDRPCGWALTVGGVDFIRRGGDR